MGMRERILNLLRNCRHVWVEDGESGEVWCDKCFIPYPSKRKVEEEED